MEISGVSGASAYSTAAGLAAEAGQTKAANVQNEISTAVIKQMQDQQEAMAESLIDMMETNLVDIYA